MGSEEEVEELLFFVDDLECELPVSEFFDGFLNVFLAETLDRNQSLTGLFGALLRVLNRNDVGFLETIGDQLVNYVFLVWQFDQVTVFIPLRNQIHVSGLIQLCQVNVGSSQNHCHVLTLDQLLHFRQACQSQCS